MRTAQLGSDTAAFKRSAASDDLDAFCRILYPELVGALTLYCGDHDVAEDLAQEALLRACEAWGRVKAMTNPHGWVFAAAFNLARSRTRRLFRQRRAYSRAVGAGAASNAPDVADAVAVRDAVAALPERQRRALILRYYADLSVQDTASAMQCAAGTVKALTSQALTGLRDAGLEVTGD